MRVFASVAGLALLCAGVAMAQDVLIDRDRADRAAPGVDLEAREDVRQAAAVIAPRAEVAPFVLSSVQLEGASLPQQELGAAIAPLIGRSFDGGNLSAIANAIAGAYRGGDVALYGVEIPEQDFSGGDVRVRVREGYVASVAIGGETSGDIDLVRYYAAAMMTERPLSRATMERQLSLLSDIPGLETRVAMSAADASGGVRLGLDLEREPWAYEIGLNNSGPDSLGEIQLSATIVRNALFRLGDQTRFTLAADSAFEHFSFAALSHRQPVGHDGASVTARISTLRTKPDGGARGRADAAAIALSYPLLRASRRNLTFGLSLDGLNSDNAELGGVTSVERTRVLRGSAAFVDWRARRTWVFGATLSQGLDALGARLADPTTAIDFTKLNLQAVNTRPLGGRFFLRTALSGQASGDVLPASERFTLGGATFGRAFAASSASGDSGYGALAELSWRVRSGWLSETYVFVDGGQVWIAERPPSAARDEDLSSAGAGVRLALGEDAALDLELAQPLVQPHNEDEGLRFRFAISAKL
jgi:hemolysin activation/secretion protein